MKQILRFQFIALTLCYLSCHQDKAREAKPAASHYLPDSANARYDTTAIAWNRTSVHLATLSRLTDSASHDTLRLNEAPHQNHFNDCRGLYVLPTGKGRQFYGFITAVNDTVDLNAETVLVFGEEYITNYMEVLQGTICVRTFGKPMDYRWLYLQAGDFTTIIKPGSKLIVTYFPADSVYEVTLISGNIWVYANHTAKLYSQPGTKLMWDYNKQSFRKEQASEQISDIFSSGRFSFKDQSLNRILLEMGNWYGKKVIYRDVDPSSMYTINGSYRMSLHTFASILEGMDRELKIKVTEDTLFVLKNNLP